MNEVVPLPLFGGCHCRRVRYRLDKPPLIIYVCHCANCQKISGSAFAEVATVFETAFSFTKGKPKRIEWTSDAGNARYGLFCGACGGRIVHGQEPSIGVLSLRAGTFDDTRWVEPAGHIWAASAQKWIKFGRFDLVDPGQPKDYGPYIERYTAQGRFRTEEPVEIEPSAACDSEPDAR